MVEVRQTGYRSAQWQFSEPHFIMVEGRDDQAFIVAILKHLELNGFHVHDMNGKDSDWQAYLRVVSASAEFQDYVRTITQIRDCDKNPSGAWQSCRDGLMRADLPIPSAPWEISAPVNNLRSSVVLLPGPEELGALEEYVLSACEQTRLDCVDSYFTCLSEANSVTATPKGRLQAYLSGFERPMREIGSAMLSRTVPPDSAAFNQLHALLRDLASETV